MDNLSAHKNHELIKHIKKCGAELLYLPPYSPDLNPIENMWSKIKQAWKHVPMMSWKKASPEHLIRFAQVMPKAGSRIVDMNCFKCEML
jgi:transposase